MQSVSAMCRGAMRDRDPRASRSPTPRLRRRPVERGLVLVEHVEFDGPRQLVGLVLVAVIRAARDIGGVADLQRALPCTPARRRLRGPGARRRSADLGRNCGQLQRFAHHDIEAIGNNVAAAMPRHEARAGIVTARRPIADHQVDGPAAVEIGNCVL
jgi:hypothetical protein